MERWPRAALSRIAADNSGSTFTWLGIRSLALRLPLKAIYLSSALARSSLASRIRLTRQLKLVLPSTWRNCVSAIPVQPATSLARERSAITSSSVKVRPTLPSNQLTLSTSVPFLTLLLVRTLNAYRSTGGPDERDTYRL